MNLAVLKVLPAPVGSVGSVSSGVSAAAGRELLNLHSLERR